MTIATLSIELEIPIHVLVDGLCTALEGGSGYWLAWDGTSEGIDLNDGPGYLQAYSHVFDRNGKLSGFLEHGDDEVGAPLAPLDRAGIAKGLAVMATKSPRHFADLVSERGDANTADVFLQYCLLGEIRYG